MNPQDHVASGPRSLISLQMSYIYEQCEKPSGWVCYKEFISDSLAFFSALGRNLMNVKTANDISESVRIKRDVALFIY